MIEKIKNLLRDTPVHYFFHGLKNQIRRYRGLRIIEQDFVCDSSRDLKVFGNKNAQWTCLVQGIEGSVVVSIGAGEDISWDVQISAAFDSKIIIVDATPRAVEHVLSVFEEIERDGCVLAYGEPVQGLKRENFSLVQKYVWTEEGHSEAFAPSNPQHVSHSIVDFQNQYAKAGDFIVVPTITLKALLKSQGVDPLELKILKMDIEGAEVEVIAQMLQEGIKPHQILVEYDELGFPTKKGIERVRGSIDMLYAASYELVWTSGVSDFLFIRSDI